MKFDRNTLQPIRDLAQEVLGHNTWGHERGEDGAPNELARSAIRLADACEEVTKKVAPWIPCGLPWSNPNIVLEEQLPPPPDLSEQEQTLFGVRYADIHDEDKFLDLSILFMNARIGPTQRGTKNLKEEDQIALEAGQTETLKNLRLCKKIEKWRRKQPSYIAWEEVRGAEFRRLQAIEDAKSFRGQGLAVPGTQVEVEGKLYLIGNINPNRGVCDDCTAFESSAIVTRYRVLCSVEETP